MIVKPLWREALRHRLPFAATLALLVAITATHIGQAVALASALAALARGNATSAFTPLALVLACALLRLGLDLARVHAAHRMGERVRRDLRRRSLERALVAERLHDRSARDGSLRQTLGDGIDGTHVYVTDYIPALASCALATPLLLAVMAWLSWPAALATAAAVALAWYGPRLWKRVAARHGLQHWDTYEALGAELLESLRSMATLRALGDVAATRARVHARSEALRAATEKAMRVSLAETAVLDLALQAGYVAAIMIAVTDALRPGGGPALHVYLLLLLASEALRPQRELARHWHAGFLGLSAVGGLTAAGAFEEVRGAVAGSPGPRTNGPRTNGPRTHAEQPTATQPAPRPPRRPADLTLNAVEFAYPDGPPVLRGVTLTAPAGRVTALMGASGIGKSTLLDLVAGFLTPAAGQIRLGDRPVQRGDCAMLSQKPVLFAGTVRDNLAASHATDGELWAALTAAGIDAEARTWPGGLDAPVAESGANFSGGQRQRLALARALLANPAVLLVDEPTSALDEANATRVLDALDAAARDRVVLLVTHRESTRWGEPVRLDAVGSRA